MKYHSKAKITVLLLLLSIAGFAQKDSGQTSLKDSSSSGIGSVKGKLFISGGLGQSTILIGIYGLGEDLDYAAYGTSQSVVYNGTIDYGIGRFITCGLGAAYQTATGVPFYAQITHTTESISRFNASARILFDVPFSSHFELYIGLRSGVSFWTDFVSPLQPSTSYSKPTMGSSFRIIYPSIQIPLGVKFLLGHFGIHFEVGIGTPYLYEGGLTIRI